MYLCAAARDWEFAGADIVAALRLVFCVHSTGTNGVEQHGHLTLAMVPRVLCCRESDLQLTWKPKLSSCCSCCGHTLVATMCRLEQCIYAWSATCATTPLPSKHRCIASCSACLFSVCRCAATDDQSVVGCATFTQRAGLQRPWWSSAC